MFSFSGGDFSFFLLVGGTVFCVTFSGGDSVLCSATYYFPSLVFSDFLFTDRTSASSFLLLTALLPLVVPGV